MKGSKMAVIIKYNKTRKQKSIKERRKEGVNVIKAKPKKPNLANSCFDRTASQVPSSKPEKPYSGGTETPREKRGASAMVDTCLSLQSPKGGRTQCCVLRGCLIITCEMNE